MSEHPSPTPAQPPVRGLIPHTVYGRVLDGSTPTSPGINERIAAAYSREDPRAVEAALQDIAIAMVANRSPHELQSWLTSIGNRRNRIRGHDLAGELPAGLAALSDMRDRVEAFVIGKGYRKTPEYKTMIPKRERAGYWVTRLLGGSFELIANGLGFPTANVIAGADMKLAQRTAQLMLANQPDRQ